MNPYTIFAYLLGNFCAGVGDALAKFTKDDFYVLTKSSFSYTMFLNEWGKTQANLTIQNVVGAEQIQVTILFRGVMFVGVVNQSYKTEEIVNMVMHFLNENQQWLKG